MKVYVINLDRHSDRLAHMRQQLGDIAFARVAAVDGSKSPETTKGLTRFELACLKSHRNAWRMFLSGRTHSRASWRMTSVFGRTSRHWFRGTRGFRSTPIR